MPELIRRLARSKFVACVSAFLLSYLFLSCSGKRETKTILLLASAEHFGLFTGEILTTEGYNHYELDSLNGAALIEKRLNDFDIVVLTMTNLTSEQAKTLTHYVEGGGNLVSFRPDPQLYSLFGIKASAGTTPVRYVNIVEGEPAGKGLISQRLIFHGDADSYELDGGKALALFRDANATSAPRPSVVSHRFGKGRTYAFAYNLPESIVYTRQGNPENAGQEKDGILGIRAMDLFTHGFVDTTQNLLNPADEQMRLFSRCLEELSASRKPLPRLWYFPDSLKCVVTLNNDGEDSREEEFLKQFQDVANHGGSMTLYIKEPQLISPKRVTSWIQDGFEISGHPDDTRQAVKPDWTTMDSVYTDLRARLQKLYGISSMKTITNHWFVWVGQELDGTPNFAAQAMLEAQHGVRLDCNYAHYDNGSDQGHFLGQMGVRQGNYTGTGLTMKFANGDGRILDIYQQLNNVYDQQYMEHKDQEGYFGAFKGLMDRSLNDEVYSSISVRAHNNEYFFSEKPLMKMLDYAKMNHVPVWTEHKWLEFLQAKDATRFDDIRWPDNILSFTARSPIAFERDLACLIPYQFNDVRATSVTMDGQSVAFSVVTIKGLEYARVMLTPGTNHTFEVRFE